MISPETLFNSLATNGVTRYCGVPDSLLKHFCAFISDHSDNDSHIITANEGSAIALAAGQYAATGTPSLVYMQNSGFGNALNPLLSLADPLVYGIPMIVMVGWRGEPGVKDEPQHAKQGGVMEQLLLACGIPYYLLDSNEKDVPGFVSRVTHHAKSDNCPVVMLVGKNTFSPYKLQTRSENISELTRESAIEEIIKYSEVSDVFVSTTGMPSRELFEIRKSKKQRHDTDFLTVGSMGHASMIALGISQVRTTGHVFCIDGDGAALMHMGNLTTVGLSHSENLLHIILNNAAHDSVGAQPTCAGKISLPDIAIAVGYSSANTISQIVEIGPEIKRLKNSIGPHFLEIQIKTGARDDLGRPTLSPVENLAHLMRFLGSR